MAVPVNLRIISTDAGRIPIQFRREVVGSLLAFLSRVWILHFDSLPLSGHRIMVQDRQNRTGQRSVPARHLPDQPAPCATRSPHRTPQFASRRAIGPPASSAFPFRGHMHVDWPFIRQRVVPGHDAKFALPVDVYESANPRFTPGGLLPPPFLSIYAPHPPETVLRSRPTWVAAVSPRARRAISMRSPLNEQYVQ